MRLPSESSETAGRRGLSLCGHESLKSLIVIALILVSLCGASADSANRSSEAQIQGQALAQEILEETPATNLTQTGILKIRNSKGITNIPIMFTTEASSPGCWQVTYDAMPGVNSGTSESLIIVHRIGGPNRYVVHDKGADGTGKTMTNLDENQIMSPFANSDFWIADLGLEFFHWPEQKIIGHETRRMRDCTVLESTNPNPSGDGYSRVVTWIDDQTLGIIHAEAYDAHNHLLKVFDPKSLKKVNGQWELQDIEIRNVQTHSRTWIRFNLDRDS